MELAADNGTHRVVSGSEAGIDALVEELEAEGVRVVRLRTSHAFHSALMEPVLEGLEGLVPAVSEAEVPWVSNVSGRVLEGVPDAAYWRRQARAPVQFAEGVRVLSGLGVGVLVEVGPEGVLGPMASLSWPEAEVPVVLLSQRRGGSGDFAEAVAGAYEAGLEVDFAGLYAGERRCRVALPTYPFQRKRYWVSGPSRRQPVAGHALLGVQRDMPDGGCSFERWLYSSDPAWLGDHRVYGEVVVPGALYAVQAVEALREMRHGFPVVLEQAGITRPLVLSGEEGRLVQVVLGEGRTWKVVSRDSGGQWEAHAEGTWASVARAASDPVDLGALAGALTQVNMEQRYIELNADGTGIRYGPVFRGLVGLWSGTGEALGEVELPEGAGRGGMLVHPALLDACFQVLGGIQEYAQAEGTWLPMGWDRLVLYDAVPGRVFCRAVDCGEAGGTRRIDLGVYTEAGQERVRIEGFALRRASRAVLSGGRVEDMLHEVVWREGECVGLRAAEFMGDPGEIVLGLGGWDRYLEAEGSDGSLLAALGEDLEREARWQLLRGLEELGWDAVLGGCFEEEELRRRLRVTEDHGRLFGRLLRVLEGWGYVVRQEGGGWQVEAEWVAAGASSGVAGDAVELGVLRRCGESFAEVLRGRADALDLLFGGEPGAASLYRESPAARAVNGMVADVLRTVAAGLPEGRPLRVLEVGAATGATTRAVLEVLPAGRTEYTFTDISSVFFADAEREWGDGGVDLRLRVLDIERDPLEQGFGLHGYDVVIAANVLHATRDLGEALVHCCGLLSPSGMLVAVEEAVPRLWLDMTFGLLPGWWRYRDGYRSDYALVGSGVWRRVLGDAGFGESVLVEVSSGALLVLARGPLEVAAEGGVYVLAGAGGPVEDLAAELGRRGVRAVAGPLGGDRQAWGDFFGSLEVGLPLWGVVHMGGLRQDGGQLTTAELAEEVEAVGGSALVLVQGMSDAGVSPVRGTWFVTRGGQVVEGDQGGALAGACLWVW